ncbi:arylsulfotransferase family protein [Ruegeria lacuscaerulensis]|uniref:arylsulfotransferase family protein n=1 Tax=Ruegeria lacuscaerulensis TaxID=55218 RepID=UPI00147CE8FC|nr:arylsulfotransferase family protein [Ruegeria lacuscaerulensis]
MLKHLDKIAFFVALPLLVVGLAFGAGMYSGLKKNFAYRSVKQFKDNMFLVFEERENWVPGGRPIHFLQPARNPGSEVTVNERPNDGSLILISGFFGDDNELRLIQRDGTLVARWPVRFSEHFPDTSHIKNPPATDHNIDTHGALILPDGSVVFNYDYGGTVKLSRCGEVVWTLAHPTHHSIEVAEGGGFWVPGRHYLRPPEYDRFWPMVHPGRGNYFLEDLVLKVSDDGEIVIRKSVPEILFDNGLEALLTATGYSFGHGAHRDVEITHVNKIEELPSTYAGSFPEFEAGDLLLSLRTYNLLFVVDPDTWKVKWHQTGPWRRQHDPEFDADGTIAVFNNNTYELDLLPSGGIDPDAPLVGNILKVDPSKGATSVAFGDRDAEEFGTVVRGKHEITGDGGYLITEFQAGRVFETDADRRIVWEYVNRYDEDEVLEVTEARLYPASYFTTDTWACP